MYFTLVQLVSVRAHGNIVLPYSWIDNRGMATVPNGDPNGTFRDVAHKITPGSCISGIPNNHCEANDDLTMWFTNSTVVPEEFGCSVDTNPRKCQIEEDLVDLTFGKVPPQLETGVRTYGHRFPWVAPGRAPIHSPCGCGGGNPDGCSGRDDEIFGLCCGHHSGEWESNCDGYAHGKNLETLEFPEPIITTWTRGKSEMVVWRVDANHWGGYSYRLCKMPEEGISYLTEECFQNNQLDFVGEEQWLKSPDFSDEEWRKFKVRQTSNGTYPEGSMWRKMPFIGPKGSDNGRDPVHGGFVDKGVKRGWIKDYVKVPEDIDPGMYVLSFRWDGERTSQVWNMCSSINLE